MLIDAAVYRGGKRVPVWNLSESLSSCSKGDGFLWIGLKEPSETEFAQVAEDLRLHPLAVEDAVVGHQRPKLEVYEDSTFIVLKTVSYIDASSDVETGEIMIFIGGHFVVTVRKGEIAPLRGVRARLERSPEALAHGPTGVLYAVLDAVVDTYVEVEAELELDLEQLEQVVFADVSQTSATEIYRLKREVLEFRRAAIPLAEPVRKLSTTTVPFVVAEGRPFFRDIADHLQRVTEFLDNGDRLLTDVLTTYLSQVSVQQNTDMRRISAWAAILAFPTLLAGVWGMNFQHMPELNTAWGYPSSLLLMASISIVLYRLFRRSGWL